MNSYEEGKKYLAQIWIDTTKITSISNDSIFSAMNDVPINVNDIKFFVAPQTPPEIILNILWLNSDYFAWKKILDLWWWFWWMPFLLENYVDNYVVCDPCFEENIKDLALQKSISIQEKSIISAKKEFEGIDNQLKNLQSRQTAARYKSNDLLEQSNNLRNNYVIKQKVLNYINMRKNFDQNQHPKIIINPSKWEDIKWIENWSQDVVLICHILDKKYLKYNGILAEASRILKDDWEILIVEDIDDDIRKILIKLWLKWEEKNYKLICRIKKTP